MRFKGLIIALVMLLFLSNSIFAWCNSIEVGYGVSHDPNGSKYTNTAAQISADLYPIKRTPWTFWSINGTVGRWHTTAPNDKNLTAGALSLALRFYPFYFEKEYTPYLFGSAGPALLSSRKFGVNTQASNWTIQSNLGLGFEFDNIDFNLRLAHFSNANLGSPNDGFNVLYLFSIGYLF